MTFLILCFLLACLHHKAVVEAFIPGNGGTLPKICRRVGQPVQSALSPQQGDAQPLSGLVGDMLNHYQAQADDLKEVANAAAACTGGSGLPQADKYGIYRIVNENQLENLLTEHPEKLVILKFSAPWCQACRALAEKFKPFIAKLGMDDDNAKKNVVFADISCNSQKSGVPCDALGVVSLPSVQFYAPGVGREPLESFACGPNHLTWSQLKDRMTAFVGDGPLKYATTDSFEQATSQKASAMRGLLSWVRKFVRRINPFSYR